MRTSETTMKRYRGSASSRSRAAGSSRDIHRSNADRCRAPYAESTPRLTPPAAAAATNSEGSLKPELAATLSACTSIDRMTKSSIDKYKCERMVYQVGFQSEIGCCDACRQAKRCQFREVCTIMLRAVISTQPSIGTSSRCCQLCKVHLPVVHTSCWTG